MCQPEWDLEQREVIQQDPATWQLVTAGPGTGKSAVACGRIAWLIDQGLPPSNILLVSFTRAAVAEIRQRIVDFAHAGQRARHIKISTLDSYAWGLNVPVDDTSRPEPAGCDGYDMNIQRTVESFRRRHPELMEFMARLQHLILDEAQDITGIRAELVLAMLRSVDGDCGVTILGDPAQAIYGFTSDLGKKSEAEPTLLERLAQESPRPMAARSLKVIHRVESDALRRAFLGTRCAFDEGPALEGMLQTIRQSSDEDEGDKSYEELAQALDQTCPSSRLVLFRRRADVLVASSYASSAGIKHRIRMSGLPVVVRPWLGWLFGESVEGIIGRSAFDVLWETRSNLASEPFAAEIRDDCWTLLHRISAGKRTGTLDLVQLRQTIARARPPSELCYPDLGTEGPILGTIHASKGRQADTVMLVMPKGTGAEEVSGAALAEERRVYYVGATRARKKLVIFVNTPWNVGYLMRSSRVYRLLGSGKAQLEIGRDGDLDRFAHLTWSNSAVIQQVLAAHVGKTAILKGRSIPEEGYAFRLSLEQDDGSGATRAIEVGQTSAQFGEDIRTLWGLVDKKRKLRPPTSIYGMAHMVAVGTVGVADKNRGAIAAPFNESALALAPVIKGFSMIKFVPRMGRNK